MVAGPSRVQPRPEPKGKLAWVLIVAGLVLVAGGLTFWATRPSGSLTADEHAAVLAQQLVDLIGAGETDGRSTIQAYEDESGCTFLGMAAQTASSATKAADKADALLVD